MTDERGRRDCTGVEQAEIARAMRKPPGSLDAYDCYLRALAPVSFTRDSYARPGVSSDGRSDLDPASLPPMVWRRVLWHSQAHGWLADTSAKSAEGVKACATRGGGRHGRTTIAIALTGGAIVLGPSWLLKLARVPM